MNQRKFYAVFEDFQTLSQLQEDNQSIVQVPTDDTFNLEFEPILQTLTFIELLKEYHLEIKDSNDPDKIYKHLWILCQTYISTGLDKVASKLDFHRTFHQCYNQQEKFPLESIHQTYKKHFWESKNIQEQNWHHPPQRDQQYCDKLCQLWLIHFNYIKRNQFLKNYGLKEDSYIKVIDLHCMKKKEAYAILMHIFKEMIKQKTRNKIFVITGLGKKIVLEDQTEIRQLKLFKYLTTEVLQYQRVLPLYSTFQADSSRGTILINL